MKLPVLILMGALVASGVQAQPAQISDKGLMVDGKPFLVLGGEVGNSSVSDPKQMGPVFDKAKAIGLNTLVVPVEWDQIEPVEGQFDFGVADALIAEAKARDLKLVILWFGAWKNSMSTYAPAWVKKDSMRFTRARSAEGVAQDILTPFDDDLLKADVKAFSAFMAHLKQADPTGVVIMVQIENEIGMLPSARDHSDLATKQFMVTRDTEERFQARSYARFVEAMAMAGKAQYDLPMYVNAALNRPGKLPGEYPSAGPLPHLFDIWKGVAPSLDMLSPDIYFPDFVERMKPYAFKGNPLFIPEAHYAGDAVASANAFYAIGELDAIGFSPFSIENLPDGDPLISAYAVLDSLAPLILAQRGKDTMRGLKAPINYDGVTDTTPQVFEMGGYRFTAAFIDPWTAKDKQVPGNHGALIIQTGKDEFIVAGSGVTLTFSDTGQERVGMEQVVEGKYENGEFVPGKWLNGDQTHQGRHLRLLPDKWGVQRLKLYKYN